MKPHKHAEVIKAWADGKPIQYKGYDSDEWLDWVLTGSPAWFVSAHYRVKPETIRYRVALFRDEDTRWTTSINFDESIRTCETSSNFVGWLTDWVEVEV